MKPEVSSYVFVSCVIKISSPSQPFSTLGSLARSRGERRVEKGVRTCQTVYDQPQRSEIGSGHYPGCPRVGSHAVPYNFATRRGSFPLPSLRSPEFTSWAVAIVPLSADAAKAALSYSLAHLNLPRPVPSDPHSSPSRRVTSPSTRSTGVGPTPPSPVSDASVRLCSAF